MLIIACQAAVIADSLLEWPSGWQVGIPGDAASGYLAVQWEQRCEGL